MAPPVIKMTILSNATASSVIYGLKSSIMPLENIYSTGVTHDNHRMIKIFL